MNILILKKTLLFLAVFSIILFPIAVNYIKYTLLISFMGIFLFVLTDLFKTKKIKIPFLWNIMIFLLIFLLSFVYSILLENNIDYIVQDSFGFILYLMFPILYLYIFKNNLFSFLKTSILFLGFFLAVLHILVFVLFNTLIGDLTFDSLIFTNNFLKSYDLSWQLGASDGSLRVNTKSGHYFLLVFTILCVDYLESKKKLIIFGIGLIFLAMILDGHRALVISSMAIMLSFIFVLFLNIQKHSSTLLIFVTAFFMAIILIFSFFIDKDKIMQKLEFKGESTELRIEQFNSLVNEIGSNPILGNGFGSYATVIRNDERPFMYELDFLAVFMKLGIPLSILYFLSYLHIVISPFYRHRTSSLLLVSSCGISYFLYMMANGGFAMSPITAFFHITFFLIVIYYTQGRTKHA